MIERDDVEINSKDNLGRTPLATATRPGHFDTVRLLIVQDDVEINSVDQFDHMPLANAARAGYWEIVKIF